jgi:hypothetical protein
MARARTVIQKNYTVLYRGHKSDKNGFGRRFCISRNIIDDLLSFEL